MSKYKHGRVGVKKRTQLSNDEEAVIYERGRRAGFSSGVQESARFYKKIIQELHDAKNFRQVRAIFARLEDVER